jgi:hypothetical protein
MTGMSGIDERARAAGEELRGWTPDPLSSSPGSPAAVAARTVHRRRVRRMAAGAAAAVLAVGLLSWQWPDSGDRVRTGPPAGQHDAERPRRRSTTSSSTTSSSTTMRPPDSSGSSVPRAGGAPTTATTGTSAPAAPGGTTPGPSVRDVDFGAATYPAPCPTYDGGSVTLSGGRATVPLGSSARLDVYLGPVGYADADGDGDEDAIVSVRCDFVGADADSGALVAAYRAGPGGEPEPIGSPRTFEHVQSLSVSGLTVTVTVDRYDADDPACCPSSRVQQTWVFDGQAFRLQGSVTLPPGG